MALYEFQCQKCGQEFEKDLPMGSQTLPRCPACGSTRTTKVFGAAGIAFKGSGFYVTDSRSGSKSGAAAGKDITPGKDASESKSDSPASEKTDGTKEAAPVHSEKTETETKTSTPESKSAPKSSGKKGN